MRLWTLHPKYLDAKGLVALWREALLAQKVLSGTKGYRHHPQLTRFRDQTHPSAAIAAYLECVHQEAARRGYQFDETRIAALRARRPIREAKGQLLYEWSHLKRKLKRRDKKLLAAHRKIVRPEPHPLFRIGAGLVRDWEKR